MRISTAEIFRNGINSIQSGQSNLSHIQQQLSSGKRILSPSDDPSGAVSALKYREGIASVDQYARNADLATSRLQQEESVLTQMHDTLQRVRELAVRGANATENNESRAAIAQELRQLESALLDAANTRDANGEYLFAGFRSSSAPFVQGGTGAVEYQGDSGQRRIALSPDRQLAVGDSGDAFMNIPRGNGTFVVTPSAANTGTGRVSAAEITDPTAIDGGSYTITIGPDAGYEIADEDGNVTAGTYVEDQAIDIGGRRIVLAGDPLEGDVFEVEPAGVISMFQLVGDLAGALETPVGDQADRARLKHGTDSALANLDQAMDAVLGLRTGVGARLNTIDSQGIVNDDQKLQLKTALSAVEDLDYADAISRFKIQEVALQAAQQTYVQMGRMSLFDYIR